MAKKTQIERAIENLQAEINVLEAAIAKLRQQQTKAPTRKPRIVAAAPRPA